jgi:hypothetical protein
VKKPGLIPDRGEIERLITAVESFNQLSEVRGELSRLMNDRRVALREKIQLSLPDMAKDLNWNFEDAVSKYRQTGERILRSRQEGRGGATRQRPSPGGLHSSQECGTGRVRKPGRGDPENPHALLRSEC